jgi:hypothetical protein
VKGERGMGDGENGDEGAGRAPVRSAPGARGRRSDAHCQSGSAQFSGGSGQLRQRSACSVRAATRQAVCVLDSGRRSGVGQGQAPGRKRFLCQLPLWFYIYEVKPASLTLHKMQWLAVSGETPVPLAAPAVSGALTGL